jgi:hypothetical protein
MLVAAVFIGLALVLFALSFFSKRRFGILGLALVAGATLSTIWGDTADLVVSATGLIQNSQLTTAIALSVVTLLPAIVLLFHGYKYKDVFSRIVGSLFFTILALILLLEPVAHTLPLEGATAYWYDQAIGYKDLIISAGIVLAVLDLFFTKSKHTAEKEGKKK